MRSIIITLLLVTFPCSSKAQLRVSSNGNVGIMNNQAFPNTKLSIGNGTFPSLLGILYKETTIMMSPQNDSSYIGHLNVAMPSSTETRGKIAVGTMGMGYGNCAEKVIGIHGWLLPNTNGAAVYGSSGTPFVLANDVRYAGFFYGDVGIIGSLTASEVVTPSDMRLKENVIPLRSMQSGTTTLDNILNMNVIQYNYIKRQTGEEDMLGVEGVDINSYVESENDRMAAQKHYGLSAQELQKIYPDLVREGQDGYLGINYVELVPILIRSIQELKQELDEVRGGNGDVKMSRSVATALTSANVSGNVLYQNTPNPFKEQTTIRFQLADNATNAAICIFDMTGKMLKKLPISSGETSVSINGWELGEGMFLYTLMVNGREIDTKRMIITK